MTQRQQEIEQILLRMRAQHDAIAQLLNVAGLDRVALKRLLTEESIANAAAHAIDWGSLPDDMFDAFESLKLSMIRHRNAGWKEVDLAKIAAMLAYLGQLPYAPPGERDIPY